MTDFSTPIATAGSQFQTGSSITGPSEIDVTSVDRALRSVKAVEQKWRLPALPETVALDLATMPGSSPESLTEFLLGIDSDLNDVEEDAPPVDPLAGLSIDWDIERSPMDRIRSGFAEFRNEPLPTEVDADAVRKFKLNAIRQGKMNAPADGRIDSVWSPELNQMRREMMYEDMDAMYAGDRLGAIPNNKTLELIGDWTQPSGLLAAATDLDLFWDFGAIGSEFSSWGDKWRKVGKAEGPLDFASSLIDAVTGPIDDIVLPAMNILMLTSGVGAVANLGRVGFMASRAAQGGRMMRGIYSSTRLLRPQTMAAMVQPSWTAGKLASKAGAAGALGDAMTAWRAFTPVARVKQGVQLGMRAGIMSQTQDLLPGYQGGVSGRDVIQPVDGIATQLRDFGVRSPLATFPELLFAPQNIFNPGSLVGKGGLLSGAGQGFLAAGGSIPGRAALGGVAGAGVGSLTGDDTEGVLQGAAAGAGLGAAAPFAARLPSWAKSGVGGGAIGAGVAFMMDDMDVEEGAMFGAFAGAGISMLPSSSSWSKIPDPGKYVGYVTDAVSRLNFRPIADDQRVGVSFHNGMKTWLADQPEELERWETLFNEHGFRGAFNRYHGLDESAGDAAIAYVALSAAIDHVSAIQAGGKHGEAFLRHQSKLYSQIEEFDLESQFLPEQVARAVAMDAFGTKGHEKRYRRVLASLTQESALDAARKHNENALATIQQLTSLENIDGLFSPAVMGAVGPWQQLDQAERLGAFESYIPNVMPTFGRWGEFTTNAHTVEKWVNDGLLDGATFSGVRTPWGSMRRPRAQMFKIDDRIVAADDEITDVFLRDPKVRQKSKLRLTPLARSQPAGTFTMANVGTISKQDLEEVDYALKELTENFERLKILRDTGTLPKFRSAVKATPADIATMTSDDFRTWLTANGFKGKDTARLRGIRSFMRNHNLTVDDLDIQLNSMVESRAMSPDGSSRWADFGFDEIVRGADGTPLSGLDALKQRRKDVAARARTTAATVDPDALVRSVRESQGDEVADELFEQLARMEADGYKLVHGQEYMMPHRLATKNVMFRDHGVRELNAATLGNFFSRKQPAVARAAQERRERASIVKALHVIDTDVSVDDPMVTQTLNDLRQILQELQDPIIQRTEDRKLLSMWDKVRHSTDSAFAPVMLQDLASKGDFVRDRLVTMGWTEDQAMAIFGAIKGFRNTEFQDLGLYSLEAKVRTKNLNTAALKWLYAEDGTGFFSPTRMGAAGGAFAGQDFAASNLDEDASGDQVAGAKIAGLVGGALLGGALGKTVSSQARSIAESRNGSIAKSLLKAEQKHRYNLGDQLVRLRDGMRFSLSPVFDATRYTEGVMLTKTGVPLRKADGSRLLLPTNMSPTAVKKRVGDGMFKEYRNQFNEIGKGAGHGTVDIADEAVIRFQQIGLMGFNPAEWQVATFAELQRAGIPAEQAYEAARSTFTYGTKGRSAAELSTNFVLFPFSFQKKALTHIAKWMQDDLGRSILIHDGLKTYEALNEKYDLNEWFSDHIPALEMLSRFNLMAYGISPGRFGGINSQLLETSAKSSMLILQMFTPIQANLKGEEDYAEFERLTRSLLPAINDINWMVEEAKETKSLMETGLMPRAQIREGYNEWNEYRQTTSEWLTDQGFTWYDLHNRPYLQQQKLAYESKLADISTRHPAWVSARRRSIFNAQALEMDKNDMLRAAAADPANASQTALMVAEFESYLALVKEELSYMGVSVDGTDGWLDAPPDVADALISTAAEMAQRNPRFVGAWNKFYLPELGPIEATL